MGSDDTNSTHILSVELVCTGSSNPFSVQVMECPTPDACTYDGRQDALTSYQATLRYNTSAYNASEYLPLLCAPGYTSNFCECALCTRLVVKVREGSAVEGQSSQRLLCKVGDGVQ